MSAGPVDQHGDPATGPGRSPVAARADEVALARAYLSRVAEPGNLAVAAFVAEHGPSAAAAMIRTQDLPPSVAAATQARRHGDPGADLEVAERHGIRLIGPESPDWPHFAFAPLYRAQAERLVSWRAGLRATRYGGEPTVPLVLWVRGSLGLADLGPASLAVVGARAATAYGEHVAAELAYGLAGHGFTVVSGGAFGIDATAHRAALAAGGPTVIVSAGGLDRPYPAAHTRLFAEVAEHGLLVSESPPGSAPQRHRFLSRNRVIAALCVATIVVEAARRSGALNTAAHAALLGRSVLAVPGPVTSALSIGCHDLLRRPIDPALLVTGAADVLELLGTPSPSKSAGAGDAGGAGGGGADRSTAPRPWDQLDPTARAVLDGLPARGWVGEDALARASAVTVPDVIRALPVLRLAGLVESGREGHRLVRTAGRAGGR